VTLNITAGLVSDFAKELLVCVCEALEETSCGCPECAYVVTGPPAWDHCCNGGQLTIGVDRIFAYERFPTPAATPYTCMLPLAADFTVTVLRCAPVPDENGNPPTAEELTTAASQVMEDMYAVMQGVMCCMAPTQKCRQFQMGSQRPVGPQGSCQGSALTLSVALPDPPCPPIA
jgi:hypothetical protein